MKRKFLKVISFFLIGILLFLMFQKILTPTRISYIDIFGVGKLADFYNEKDNSIDVIIGGTSHSADGILPMELYEKYGIKAYNLSTSEQPIEVTYYMLCEAVKTQKPEIFIWDVSNIYVSEDKKASWKRVTDEMRIGGNKLILAKEYCEKYHNESEAIYEIMFPLLEYHTRWKDLSWKDFMCFHCNKYNYRKGGEIVSTISDGEITVEAMNDAATELSQDMEKVQYTYTAGVYQEESEEDILYSGEIPNENIAWFLKIKEFCDENNIQLLIIKVPSVNYPQQYRSAWTEEKYKKIQELCGQYGVPYYDLLYDTDIGIDWKKDSMDGGYHLNLCGAQKVTVSLGSYLKEHYELLDAYDEEWDEELVLYQKVREAALFQLERDFDTYIDILMKEHKDNMIFIAASDDMAEGLNETDVNLLRQLGLQTDFSNAFRKSYVAVIDNGEVAYEALSNRSLNYKGRCKETKKTYELYSSGWWTSPTASIKIADDELAINSRGLNIVVYDDEKGLVLDSVCFDTYEQEHTAVRNNERINMLRQEFEEYLMETETF